jgi:PAS domain S-box-containing protein
MRSERILIVEDEALIAEEIRERLAEAGYPVLAVADTGAAAIELVERTRPNLVLMDIRLKGGMDGIEAAQTINDRFGVPVVYLTAYSDQATLQRAKMRAAFGYVLKPFQVESLLIAIDLGLHRAAIEARLEEHQLALATILGSVSDAVITTDVAGRVRFMNTIAEQLTGRSVRDAEGRQFAAVVKLVDEAGQPAQDRLVKRVVEGRASVRFARSDHLIRCDGERIPIDGAATPVIDYLDRLVGITVTFADATDARRGEHELRIRSEELQVVVDAAIDGVLLLDRECVVRMFNPACERLFGYTRDEVIGRSVLQLMPSPLADAPGGLSPAAVPQRRLFASGRTATGRRKDGSTMPIEVSVGEAYRDGALQYVVVVHDATERRDLQDAYADAVGQERRRIAQDLHDGLGQELTGLALLLSALERAASEANLPNAEDLGRVRDLASHTIATCRNAARGLMPVAEIQGGLVAGLRELVRRLNDLPGPPVHFSVIEAAAVGLSAAATDHLYHIAQEALTNAIKHSAAQSIQLTLDVGRSSVLLKVCDDGNGIVVAQPDAVGLGLRTMRYRADLIGARISIQPQARAGTCVVCECPQPL